VQRAVQIIDQHWPLDLPALSELPCLPQLLLERPMRRKILAGMRFSGIEKHRGHVLCPVAIGDLIERWRRQRAVRSGQ